MMIDGRNVPTGSTVDADVCIVGGGPVGIALALYFVNQLGVTVALIESGGREWDERTQELSSGESNGHDYFPVKETHLRVLGGTTLSYGGVCNLLSDLDFEQRYWVPDSGWPLKRQTLDPYLQKAYDLLGVTYRMEPQTHRDSSESVIWKRVLISRPPTRFGKKFAPDLEKAANVTTYLHSTVTNLELHPGGAHISGVTASCFGGSQYRINAKHYVLAGGGIEIPRLLLASNDIAGAGIGNEYDNVGRYFQEHPRAIDRYRVPGGTRALSEQITGASGTLHFSRLALTEKAQREERLLDYHANVSFGFAGQDTPQWNAIRRVVVAYRSPWSDSPYFQGIGGGRSKVSWEDIKTSLLRPHRTVQSLVGASLRPRFMQRWVELASSVEQVPRRENRVTLRIEKDDLGMPLIDLHWSLDDHEMHTYYRGRELALQKLDQLLPGLSQHRMDEPDAWPDKVIGTWHHSGTTRMHSDPRKGVVDADAKVHGIDNLFIVGSSVFPTSGSVSPTAVSICLALRLGEHLKSLL